jgi:polyribonucleotide nucleotidyltransferase
MSYLKREIEIGGRILSFEIGKYAKQADGAVMVRYADTMVLATAVAENEPKEDIDFMPLSVEYREKTSAAGKIPGGFEKREGKPTEKEILSARLIDRALRPLFPKEFKCETQVTVTVFSFDLENDPDVIGGIASSTALMISDIPWNGPIAEVRVGKIDGQFVINPTISQLDKSELDLVVAGTIDSIVMVEGEAKEISERDMVEAIKFAHEYIKKICEAQIEIAKEVGKPKRELVKEEIPERIVNDVKEIAEPKIKELNRTPLKKLERKEKMDAILLETIEALKQRYMNELVLDELGNQIPLINLYPKLEFWVKQVVEEIERLDMRYMVLREGRRIDGRGLNDIRPITAEVGVLPRTHGSALFTRGETQSLATVTLGTKMDEQLIDGLLPEYTKRFMLHYNFPPFSVGEVAPFRGPSRREIGHGNLAERALKNLIPPEEEFPYTIRVVSDILESNGSSSMATVCSGTLALMDGGIPLKKHVAGIAMGLVKEGEEVAILTDILGNEDRLGDMDFKVAGTRDGITAFQMDIKISGISYEIFERALEQAKEARMKILDILEKTIPGPRPEISPYAPRLITTRIPVEMIGWVIGPAGKNIKMMKQEFGAEVFIEDDGLVWISGPNKESCEKAKQMVEQLAEVPEVGKVYKGIVRKIADFGAFVEILPGKIGLLHISEIDHRRIEKVSDVLKVGDEVEVQILTIDDMGRFTLSRKSLIPKGEQVKPQQTSRQQTTSQSHPQRTRK